MYRIKCLKYGSIQFSAVQYMCIEYHDVEYDIYYMLFHLKVELIYTKTFLNLKYNL